jgi:hypothetical protein
MNKSRMILWARHVVRRREDEYILDVGGKTIRKKTIRNT